MSQEELFKTEFIPAKAGSGNLFEEKISANTGPVECLGQTFESDKARREHYLERLKEALNDLYSNLENKSWISVEDTLKKFSQISLWPMGSEEQQDEIIIFRYYLNLR